MLFDKKKPDESFVDMPSKLMTANPSEIANEAKAVTDFSYPKAFKDSKILIIGDTDHRDAKIVGSLASSAENMTASGVKRLLIELPKDPDTISAVNELNSSGNTEGLSSILDKHSRNPLQLLRLLKEAHANGIEIVPIDMPFSLQSNFEDETLAKERGIYMGNEIAKYSNEAEGKTIVFCGLNHLNSDQIPAVLKAKSISYRSATIFTEGQSTSLFLDTSPIELGVCRYVESQNRRGKDTIIGLKGSYGIDSILYLKWQPQEHLNSEDPGSACIYPELKSSMQKDVYADFSDSVEPNSKLWKNSNLKKIVITMEMFGSSFNEFQKFYLSISLNTYLNSTMHNGGGSIVDIKYDSRDQAFKIRAVDTFHYKYLKNADYGTSMHYREVTLGMLLSQYGLPKSSLTDESAFRDVVNRIKIEPQGKDVAYKLILMALASSKSDIGTVRNDIEGIYLANGHGEKAVSVGLGEIRQDVRTSSILEAGREVLEWSLATQDALYKAIGQDSEMKPKTKRSLMNAIGIDGMMKPMYFFFDGISMRVSEAYSRFERMSDSEFSALAKDFIREASALEESLRQIRALLPGRSYKAFDINSMLMSDKRYVSGLRYGTRVETLIDSCIKVMEAKKVQMKEELSKNVYINADIDLLRR